MKTLAVLLALTMHLMADKVRIEDIPERGVQPQVAVDAQGTVHLIYLKGNPQACDVRYVRRAGKERAWSAPVAVNSAPATAVAMGTIRGAQFAMGPHGALHIVWNGVMLRGGGEGAPLYYTRFEPGQKKFIPQRNLLSGTRALDGGASVAADDRGNVFVVWHGQKAGVTGDESARMVFVIKSADSGQTFGTPTVANADFTGTCACCSIKTLAAPGGRLITLYRAAHLASDRDLTLLASSDAGATFSRSMIDSWKSATCPMSSAALLLTPQGVRAAWETEGKIRSMLLGAKASPAELATKQAKHPSLAANSRGETLAAWIIGTGWNRGGELGWTVLDAAGNPTAENGRAPGVPPWSHAAAYADANGEFVILR